MMHFQLKRDAMDPVALKVSMWRRATLTTPISAAAMRAVEAVLDRDDTALRPVGLGVLAHSFKLEQARSRSTSTRSCIRSARSARRALA